MSIIVHPNRSPAYLRATKVISFDLTVPTLIWMEMHKEMQSPDMNFDWDNNDVYEWENGALAYITESDKVVKARSTNNWEGEMTEKDLSLCYSLAYFSHHSFLLDGEQARQSARMYGLLRQASMLEWEGDQVKIQQFLD